MWAVLMWWTRTLSSTFAGNSFLHWSHLIVRAAAGLNPDLIACDFGLLVIHLLILAPRAPLPVAPPLGLPLPRPDPPPTRTEPELTSTVTASRPWFCFNYAFDSFQTFVMSASLSFSFWSSPRLTRRQRSFTWRGQKGNYFLSEKEKKRRKEHREYLRLDKLCVFEDVSSQSWWHRCPQRRLLKKMVHSGQNIRGDKDLLRYIR